ncbi:polyketide synthase dehydratase domain-containing protein, partial [Wenjunlia tyrosinilytica]|uniref:polyketide synthase dehydratase domain-containing protein n=1 Tax=Wenjunlia tyrosinilytica TaxID=1544741 RepID=UPI00166AE651
DRSEVRALLSAVAEAFTDGADVDWSVFFPRARHVELPTYAFQRSRYWPRLSGALLGDLGAAGLASADHPLLGAAVTLADSGSVVLTGRLSARTQPWLAEHAVSGSILFPGTGFLELAAHAADQVKCGQVEELTLEAPLMLPERGAVQLQLVVAPADESGRRLLGIYSRPDGASADPERPWTRHAGGALLSSAEASEADLSQWPPADAGELPMDTLYDRLAEGGFDYGPVFCGLKSVWQRGDDLFAEASLPEAAVPEAKRFGIHPALLDAVLHALGVATVTEATSGADEGGKVPFAWSGVTFHACGAASLRARLSRSGPDTVALELADASGMPVATIESLTMRALSSDGLGAARPELSDLLYRVDWVPAPVDTATDAHRDAAEPVGFAPASQLVPAALAESGEGVPADVFIQVERPDGDVVDAVRAVTARVLGLVQEWLAAKPFEDSRLVVVTEGAVAVDHAAPDPVSAAVWGLVRAARSEHPTRFALVDVVGAAPTREALSAALSSGEPELAVRASVAYVPRLSRMTSRRPALSLPPDAAAWRLDIVENGTLEGLGLTACPDVTAELGAGQVRVSVRAAGVNFRDVLNTLGMYPGDASDFGLEGAGVVAEVGPGVSGVAVGDRVMGLIPGAFGPVAVADARTVVRIPAGWSFAQAASVPIVFLTAYYALTELGGVQAGESVLVHAAAGGVGMAAVQLARHLGAEVFGTASVGKWPTLHASGLDSAHVASSRDLGFERAFLAATGGRGVDVVLDSLAGEFVDASL